MGVSFEFYAGDPAKIGPAFTKIELNGLRDGTLAHNYADFSLHISPDDLDTLSRQVAAILTRPPILLLKSLEQRIGGTPNESDAFIVSRAWVNAVATILPEQAAQLTRNWLQAASIETGEEYVTDSPDAVAAVCSLIDLCRHALARDTSVIWAWYL